MGKDTKENIEKDTRCRSWFIVLNNPREHMGDMVKDMSDQEICEFITKEWCKDKDSRAAACVSCLSEKGLDHLHIVLESTTSNGILFSTVRNFFKRMGCSPHIEPTKGNKSQTKDYINKKGKYAEKGEIVKATHVVGEINGAGQQGKRTDLERMFELIQKGKTPKEVLYAMPNAYRYENSLKSMYYDKRKREVGISRDVTVHWECGPSGSGKTYVYVELCERFGSENVYLMNCFNKNPFDGYQGQKYIVMDEFRGGCAIDWGMLLQMLDNYVVDMPARYSDVTTLWSEVWICVVNTPEETYSNMISNKGLDSIGQLQRRINDIAYHYVTMDFDGNKEYRELRYSQVDYLDAFNKLYATNGKIPGSVALFSYLKSNKKYKEIPRSWELELGVDTKKESTSVDEGSRLGNAQMLVNI